MRLFVHIIGWLILLEGVLFLVWPQMLGPMLRFFNSVFRLCVLSSLRMVLGGFFLFAATGCKVPMIVATYGIFMLIVGAAGLMLREKLLQSVIQWWQERNLSTVQKISSVVILLGAVLIYGA